MTSARFATMILIVGSALLSGCKETSNPVTSLDTGLNLIVNPYFTKNGSPSLEGWAFLDTAGFVFSADVPPGGFIRSLSMPTAWFAPIKNNGIWTTAPVDSGTHIYRLSCWAKRVGVGGSILVLPPGALIDSAYQAHRVSIVDTVWTFYTTLDTVTSSQQDSVVVFLGRGVSELAGGWTFYEDCSFVFER